MVSREANASYDNLKHDTSPTTQVAVAHAAFRGHAAVQLLCNGVRAPALLLHNLLDLRPYLNKAQDCGGSFAGTIEVSDVSKLSGLKPEEGELESRSSDKVSIGAL